jgi:hypothetical protein
MIWIIGSIFGAIPAVSAIRIGSESLINFWMLGLTVLTFGIGAGIGAFGVAHSSPASTPAVWRAANATGVSTSSCG